MYCLNCGKKLEIGEKFCKNCGNKTKYHDENGIGKIIISRVNKYTGCLIDFEVFIDEDKVGVLKNGNALTYQMPYGIYNVRISFMNSSANEQVTISEAKKEVEITVTVKMGLLAGKPHISSVQYK